ncbi:substrate-binding periplasmic protein [Roseateles albus]|uniref:Transporter substrate-binding domain-containing protein n=1 Tax=Roseateles albus TaxID=2987525 RepID=A0ABT5KFF7_9BURK|nr:transporter substrate-binding domain-containing protein [Roseateles albus]MDC8772663.1 transporter substrate-binding domain-containing protein [Roseateles albus]
MKVKNDWHKRFADADCTLHRRQCLQWLGLSCMVPLYARAGGALRVDLLLLEGASINFVLPLVRLIGEAAGIEWQIKYVPFARMLQTVKGGQALALGVSKSPEREQSLAFSDSVTSGYVWLVTRRNNVFAYRAPDDLRGHAMCTGLGMTLGAEFERLRAEGLRVERFSGRLSQGLAMLSADRCDVLVVTSHLEAERLERALQKHENADVVVMRTPLTNKALNFSVCQGHALAMLLPRINSAIDQQRNAIKMLVSQAA